MKSNKGKNLCVRRRAASLIIAVLFITAHSSLAQTRVETPNNKYRLSDDVRLGREAAQQVRRQYPLLPERGGVDNYVEQVGRRLVRAIPPRLRHSQFHYRFNVVNASDINAFALPGGPLYVNRGVIEAAHSEGELAGVMAHEIAHIALRHGTAQATKAQSAKFQMPAIGGAILGAIVGGTTGNIIAQGAQTGLGIYFLKYSREYEEQADVLGAQIMARAGYDPRDLANMFRTIERQSGSGGPEFLSDHPNPGDRYERITEEARRLKVSPGRATQNTARFRSIQETLHRMRPAPTTAELARRRGNVFR